MDAEIEVIEQSDDQWTIQLADVGPSQDKNGDRF
jgi:hypothetical protein